MTCLNEVKKRRGLRGILKGNGKGGGKGEGKGEGGRKRRRKKGDTDTSVGDVLLRRPDIKLDARFFLVTHQRLSYL